MLQRKFCKVKNVQKSLSHSWQTSTWCFLAISHAEITLTTRSACRFQPLGADMQHPHLVRGSAAILFPSVIVWWDPSIQNIISDWHSVTCLQEAVHGEPITSFTLLRFYKSSCSPAVWSTQRITHSGNNKRAAVGMATTSHTAQTAMKGSAKLKSFFLYEGDTYDCEHRSRY